ncbi:MAG TPA: ROK family protein [Flavisolibacter sp.]|nr:ROK family protein [Flavisolibacter sp.]
MYKAYQKLAVGIDIGGTNTKIGIINHRGEILSRACISTVGHETVEDFIEALYNALQPLIEEFESTGEITGIGIGAPNGNFYTGLIEYAPNLRWNGTIPLAKFVTERFGIPCSLTNDANAAALGELYYGAGRGMKHFLVITLGTGIGSGIVIDGKLIYGHDGYAGELGHTIIRYGGRKHWKTDLVGSLETYCSATGIAITAREMLKRTNQESLLRAIEPEKINSKYVYECAIKGDKLALKVFKYTGKLLGEALANFVMFSSPEAIILFGGVIKSGELLMKPTRKHMEKNLLPLFQNKVKLVFSELEGADSAILGAGSLVWEQSSEAFQVAI